MIALEKLRDDAIDSLADLREDFDRSSARIQVQSKFIDGLCRQLDEPRNTIGITERIRHQVNTMSNEVLS